MAAYYLSLNSGDKMKLPRNLGPQARVGYVLTGAALLAAALLVPALGPPWSWIAGFFGVVVIAEGAVGF